jgi:hypothetical protein
MKSLFYIFIFLFTAISYANDKAIFRLIPLKSQPENLTTEAFSDYDTHSGFLGKLFHAQLKECQNKKQSHCPLLFDNVSTSFVIKKDKKFFIVTSRHTFEEETKTPAFLLYDAEDKLIIDTRKNTHSVKWVTYWNPSHPKYAISISSDWVEVEIDHSFKDHLEWADENALVSGTSAYALGYLQDTLNLQKERIEINTGYETGKLLGWDKDLDKVEKYLDGKLISFSLAVNSGASGSPILNLEGKVVGLISYTSKQKNFAVGPNLKGMQEARVYSSANRK